MKGLLHYHFHNYLRSHRYIPPLSLYILSLVINYTYTPNPILDSYSFTSLLLYVFAPFLYDGMVYSHHISCRR